MIVEAQTQHSGKASIELGKLSFEIERTLLGEELASGCGQFCLNAYMLPRLDRSFRIKCCPVDDFIQLAELRLLTSSS